MRQPIAVVSTLLVLHPLLAVRIPLYCFASAYFESFDGLATQLALGFARIDGVILVVQMVDLRFVAEAISLRAHLLKRRAIIIYDFDIRLFAPTADAVGFARTTCYAQWEDRAQ